MMNIVGPSQCGKTFWIYKLIKYIDELIIPMPKSIVYLHGTEYQKLFDDMKREVKKKEGKWASDKY